MQKSDLVIPVPCTVDWQKMTPADKGRFCGDCKKVVRDLSKMAEADARELVANAKSGELCVRFLYDRHGKVFFAGEKSALVPQSFLNRAKRTALAAASLAVPVMLQACAVNPFGSSSSSLEDQNDPSLTPSMGGVSWDDRPFQVDAGADPDATDAAPPAEKTDAAPTTSPDASPDGGTI